MKKYIVGLAPIAVVAAMALAPSSALASGCSNGAPVCTWTGWSTSHSDYVDAGYATGIANFVTTQGKCGVSPCFGQDGAGNSTYCVTPNVTSGTADTADGGTCSAGGTPVVTVTGVFVPTKTGCGAHEGSDAGTANDPCTTGDTIVAFFIGVPAAGQGVGLQG